MIDAGTTLIDEQPEREHKNAAMAACILSVVMHAALLFFFSGTRFNLSVVSSEIIRERRAKSMKLMDVKREPRGKEPGSGTVWPEAPSPDTDPAREIDALSVPPNEAAMEPPALAEYRSAREMKNIAGPGAIPERERWEPRQEILVIENRIASVEISTLERRRIPRIERVSKAPDVVVSVDREVMEKALRITGETPARADIGRKTIGGTRAPGSEPVIGEPAVKEVSKLFVEKTSEITPFKPIENLLVSTISTYTSFRDPKYGYFKIEIRRAGADILPVIPKDIMLVQDCSASIAEQRLYFCRNGLIQCLSLIGPEDRFNVVGFSDSSRMCFADWSNNTPEAVEKAKHFIRQMTSGGNTDIFSSIKDLIEVTRIPGRPLIMLLVTDGRPTAGMLRSTDIIGEFSRLNNGAISVFTMGTVQTANSYLLDLLSYCNRGGSLIVTKGRWDIPDSIHGIIENVSRPVLTDVGFRFADADRTEVYPVLTANLYLDQALVLYGRYPRDTGKIVFQAIGQAGDFRCDMIFDLDLGKTAKSGDKDLRQRWAKQKIYHLIGEYARKSNPAILKEIKATAKAYRVKIPYKGKF